MTWNVNEGRQPERSAERLPAWTKELGETTLAAVRWAFSELTPAEAGQQEQPVVSALGALPLQRMATA